MLHRVRTLVTVLALGLSGVAAAQPAVKKKPDPVSAFLQQDKYTYCDVKILASLWKVSVRDAKANVGTKLLANDTRYIETQLGDARSNAAKNVSARCTFSEAGFTYDDAKKLAKIWKKTEAGAKAMAEAKILGGGERGVRELLGQTTSSTSEDPTSAYLKQDKYTYCDVKQLSALWKASIMDTKARVGMKLQANATTYLDSELVRARKNPKQRCTWDEAGLTYTDIEALAKLWKVSVIKAKAMANQKATSYGAAALRDQLGASSEADADLEAFLTQDKYTYCDAAAIGAMWKQSALEGKTFIGMKLRVKNTAVLDKTVAEARTFAAKNPVAGCERATKPVPKKPVPPPKKM